MTGKPTSRIVDWNKESLEIFRQVYRVAADEKFRVNERPGVKPTSVEIIKEHNVTTNDGWETFKFDLLTNGGRKMYEGLEFDRKFASYLIQMLIKKLNLPMGGSWYAASFAQAWERKPM